MGQFTGNGCCDVGPVVVPPDHQTARIIVGNALAGDTITNCDFLDPGDGTGIAAALVAAGAASQKDVFIRSGTYTLTTALSVPAGVRLIGAGVGQTSLVGPSTNGVSMTILACAAGTATAPTRVEGMTLTSPAPVSGVTVPSNCGMVTVLSYCEFRDIDLTITGSASVSHPCPVGFANQGGLAQIGGLSFVDVTVRTSALTNNVADALGWSIKATSDTVTAFADPSTFVRCSFIAEGSESVSYSVIGFLVQLDKLRIDSFVARRCAGGYISHACSGATVGPQICDMLVDARGTAASRAYDGLRIAYIATSAGSVSGMHITGLRLLGDGNVAAAAAAFTLGSTASATATLTIEGAYVEVSSRCTVAGAGSVGLNGEACSLTGGVLYAQIGTGDVLFNAANSNGFTKGVEVHAGCRNFTIASSTFFSYLRLESPRITGTLTIGTSAANTSVVGGFVGVLANTSVSTTLTNVEVASVGVISTLPKVTATPATPLAGQMTSYADALAGRLMAYVLGDDGIPRPGQAFLGQVRVGIYNPSGSVTTQPGVFGLPNISANDSSVATARVWATTNAMTRTRRIGYVGNSAAGRSAGFRWGGNFVTIGDGAGTGGFLFMGTFGCSDAATVAGARQWYGMINNAGAQTGEPSALTNCLVVGNGAADTNLKIFYGGSAAQTAIDLGVNFPANTLSTDMYEFALWASPNASTVGYRVRRLGTAFVASGTLSGTVGTALPAVTTGLGFGVNRYNNATALAVGIDLGQHYIETEY